MMKRFFCTVCKKVKRVRNVPQIIDTPNAVVPSDRIGQCDWHSMGRAYMKSSPKSGIKSTASSKRKVS